METIYTFKFQNLLTHLRSFKICIDITNYIKKTPHKWNNIINNQRRHSDHPGGPLQLSDHNSYNKIHGPNFSIYT